MQRCADAHGCFGLGLRVFLFVQRGVEFFLVDLEAFEAALHEVQEEDALAEAAAGAGPSATTSSPVRLPQLQQLRRELFEIRELLSGNR